MTSKQISVMAEALEFFTQFLGGQTEYMPNALVFQLWETKKDDWQVISEVHQNLATVMKANLFDLPQNANHGIHSDIPEVAVSYEMYKMVLLTRHIEWQEENPEDESYSVHSAGPLHISGEPLIKINTTIG